MKICKGSMVVLKGIKRYGWYNLDSETLAWNSAFATAIEDQKYVLWYKRLGHISEKGLHIGSNQKL